MSAARSILAIDATSALCSVAWTDGTRWVERVEEAGQRHTELILGLLDATLGAAGCRPADLTEVAFGAGPGSFTGLRIACGVAQGLALGCDLPVRAVSSLMALAQTSLAMNVLVAIDARMNEVYWAAYRQIGIGTGWDVVAVPAVAPAAAVVLPDGDDWVGVGDGFAAYPALASRFSGRLRVEAAARITARGVAELALAGQGVLGAADTAAPAYVRDKVARTTLERAGIR
ncbi:MAG: tRNA (adenosine(37)-N6)-threonylcarbamoyltransferase complex dimerization subunit type 1 TsaB [Betaproteobacteria bacterium]